MVSLRKVSKKKLLAVPLCFVVFCVVLSSLNNHQTEASPLPVSEFSETYPDNDQWTELAVGEPLDVETEIIVPNIGRWFDASGGYVCVDEYPRLVVGTRSIVSFYSRQEAIPHYLVFELDSPTSATQWKYFMFFLKLYDKATGNFELRFFSNARFADNPKFARKASTSTLDKWIVHCFDLKNLAGWSIDAGFNWENIYGFCIYATTKDVKNILVIDHPIFTNGTASVFLPPTRHSWRTVNVMLAMDEEFLAGTYENPVGEMTAEDYARLQIRRASWWFNIEFGIDLVVATTTTWDSNDRNSGEDLFYELLDETAFESGMEMEGVTINVLIAWTRQTNLGVAGFGDNKTNAVILRPQLYCFDDNAVQHEVSHVFSVEDGTYENWYAYGMQCYNEECVMSYRQKYVYSINEDGAVFKIDLEGPVGYQTNKWCDESWKVLNVHKDKFGVGCVGGC